MNFVSLQKKQNDKKLSVIIPTYNEEERIVKTLKEVEKTFAGMDYEIVVVDDGSTDKTWNKVFSYAENNDRVKLIGKNENCGKGGALKSGFLKCSGDLILFVDADLELHPRQFFLFYEMMKLLDSDGIVGSKRHPLSKVDYPF